MQFLAARGTGNADITFIGGREIVMGTSEQYFSLVATGKSSWAAVHVNSEARTAEAAHRQDAVNGSSHLFAEASEARLGFTDRFPRFTIAMIALALFAVSASMEIEWLRHAGYFWR